MFLKRNFHVNVLSVISRCYHVRLVLTCSGSPGDFATRVLRPLSIVDSAQSSTGYEARGTLPRPETILPIIRLSPNSHSDTQRTWDLNTDNLSTTPSASTVEDCCRMITIFCYRSFSCRLLARWESRQMNYACIPEKAGSGHMYHSMLPDKVGFPPRLCKIGLILPIIYLRMPRSMHQDRYGKTLLFHCYLLSFTCATA